MFNWTVSLQKSRPATWYVTGGIIVAALVIWGFIERMYGLSIVAIIFTGVFILIENNAPESSDISVDENGIGVGMNFYDYAKIDTFSVIFENKVPIYLRINLKAGALRIIDVDMPTNGSINAAELRRYLSNFVEESESAELSGMDKFLRKIGF